MKKLFYIIIPALILSVACNKENNAVNQLSGKIKTAYTYDSLNTLIEKNDYYYDASDNLYQIKSNSQRMILSKLNDTLILEIHKYDTLAIDTVTTIQYAYLNNRGYIHKIEYLDSNHTRQLLSEYLTDANGILLSTLPITNNGITTKSFDFLYLNNNYLSYKDYYKFYISMVPPYYMEDTMEIAITYTDLVDLSFPFNDPSFRNSFNFFGYKNAVANQNLVKSIMYNSQDTVRFDYRLNQDSHVIENTFYNNNRYNGKVVLDYY